MMSDSGRGDDAVSSGPAAAAAVARSAHRLCCPISIASHLCKTSNYSECLTVVICHSDLSELG